MQSQLLARAARHAEPAACAERPGRADLLLGGEMLTRSQISEYTGVSKVTVSQMLARLEERGRWLSRGAGRGPRPNAALYSVVPSSAYVAGLSVDFDLVSAAVADVTGRRVAEVSGNPNGTDDPVELVRGTIEQACASAGIEVTRLSALVIGSPGVVDPRTGDPRLAVNLPAWHEGALDALTDAWHKPVVIENDVNLAAMAERADGAAASADDFVLVWLGVGLGLATILGGRLHRGTAGAAGEIGYLPVHGAPLHTDLRHPASGGFQSLAGGNVVRELAAGHGFTAPTPAEAVRAAVSRRRATATAARPGRGLPQRARAPGRGRGRVRLRRAGPWPRRAGRRGGPGRRHRPGGPGRRGGGEHLAVPSARGADRRSGRAGAARRDAGGCGAGPFGPIGIRGRSSVILNFPVTIVTQLE
jgi:predicted NBD/HSP70 family sugar kinase